MSTLPSTFLDQVFTRKLFAFAGTSLLVYDYLLSLPLEVMHIWNEPWTPVKALFLINRYGNLIGQSFIMLEETGYLSHGSRHFCIGFQLYSPFFAVFSGESIRLFVVMRACAISGCKRSIALFVTTVYILYAIGILVLSTYLSLLNIDVLQFDYLDEVGLCVAFIPPNIWAFWFISLFLDGFILVFVWCTLYRFTRGFRSIYPSGLIRLLARDALLFYFATLFNDVFSIVCWTIFSQDPRSFLQTLITYPVLTVIGQRLVLNLRRYRVQPDRAYDISQEVNRQIAALAEELSSDGPDPGLGLELDELSTDN